MKTITVDDNRSILELMKHILNQINPSGNHFFADNAGDALNIIEQEHIHTVFLDIEMPGMSGADAARYLNGTYGKIDIIFITGHTEYAMLGHELHCAAFVTKPFDKRDILEALEYLRLPVEADKVLNVKCDGQFTVKAYGEPLQFKRNLTYEMLAYLVYKKGATVTNGELIGILWDGDPNKQDHLRKLVKDLRDCFGEKEIDDLLIRHRGSIGINMNEVSVDGDPDQLADLYGWLL